MKVEKGFFGSGVVELDGHEFIGCTFERSILLFRGGSFTLNECKLIDVNIRLEGAAHATMQFLAAMVRGMGDGGREAVEKLFAGIMGNGAGAEKTLLS